jgi:hypothetical protein
VGTIGIDGIEMTGVEQKFSRLISEQESQEKDPGSKIKIGC